MSKPNSLELSHRRFRYCLIMSAREIQKRLISSGLWKEAMTGTGFQIFVEIPKLGDDLSVEVVYGLSFEENDTLVYIVEFGRNTLDTLWEKLCAKNMEDQFAMFSSLAICPCDNMLYIANKTFVEYSVNDLIVTEDHKLIHTKTNETIWKPPS